MKQILLSILQYCLGREVAVETEERLVLILWAINMSLICFAVGFGSGGKRPSHPFISPSIRYCCV